jgi:hypothetical protein
MGDDFLAGFAGIVEQLSGVRGVEAVVLGGSRGRGTHSPDSDYDVGIYFDSPETFDIARLNGIAQSLDDEHRAGLCTPVGGWGPWVNGGGWLLIKGAHVDFIYRELPRIQRVVDDCLAGKIEVGYQPGHPFGFVSAIYMGEIATCRLLWDRQGELAALKAKTQPYPPALKRALMAMGWEAGFCAAIAEKPAKRGDLNYVAGALFRGATCLALALFGLNEQWWLNEKGAVELASSFSLCPPRFAERVNEMFTLVGTDAPRAVAMLAELDGEVAALCKASA